MRAVLYNISDYVIALSFEPSIRTSIYEEKMKQEAGVKFVPPPIKQLRTLGISHNR